MTSTHIHWYLVVLIDYLLILVHFDSNMGYFIQSTRMYMYYVYILE